MSLSCSRPPCEAFTPPSLRIPALDGSGYDKIWDDSSDETSDKVEILPPSWDADEDFYFVNHYEEQQLQRMYLN